jgi:hypothetical protein
MAKRKESLEWVHFLGGFPRYLTFPNTFCVIKKTALITGKAGWAAFKANPPQMCCL